MGETAIRVEGLSKRYRIGPAAERHRDLRSAFGAAVRSPFRNLSRLRRLSRFADGEENSTIWALKDVSFAVRHGEVLGIIGRNGAGKSTLLRILSRITEPTTGRVHVHGRVGALLEVGTGFHAELTGRENVYLNGSILGMDKRYIDRKFNEIVEFSGVEKFIDTPVKRYSSGMYLRLAFSVAAHLEPEILVVDEVLAVGDLEFQQKCLGKMGEVAGDGRTVLFVSHNMAAVEALCGRCVLLKDGYLTEDAEPSTTIAAYLNSGPRGDPTDLLRVEARRGAGEIRFSRLWLIDEAGQTTACARTGAGVGLAVALAFNRSQAAPVRARLGIAFATVYRQVLWVCSTELTHGGPFWLASGQVAVCHISRFPLAAGKYLLTLFLEADGVIQDWLEGVELIVEDGDYFGLGRNAPPGWEGKTVLVDHMWTTLSNVP